MNLLDSLPIEIYLTIRSYFYRYFSLISQLTTDEVILEKESRRNWRSFLSTSNQEYWKEVRKMTMIFDLNVSCSTSYLNDQRFHDLVVSKVSDTTSQVHLLISDHLDQRLMKTLDGVNFLNLGYNASFRTIYFDRVRKLSLVRSEVQEIQNMSLLEELNVSDCHVLQSLGSFPNLRCLNISRCNTLQVIGELPSLKHLEFLGLWRLHPLLPLTQLEIMKLSYPGEAFDFNQCVYLKKLVVHGLTMQRNISVLPRIPPLSLPNLSSLEIFRVVLTDIANLPRLSSLILRESRLENGIDRLYQLRVLHIDGRYLMDLSPERFSRLSEFQLMNEDEEEIEEFISFHNNGSASSFCHRQSLSFKHSFHLDNSAVSLKIHPNTKTIKLAPNSTIHSIEFIQPIANNYDFTLVSLISLTILHLDPMLSFQQFSRVYFLRINYCQQLTRVDCFANVPILSLKGCSGIISFQGLGKQRYLDLSETDISDTDMFALSDVHTLVLTQCHRLTDLSMLVKTVLLTAVSCKGLVEVVLSGRDYEVVRLDHCMNLRGIRVAGRVRSLSLPRGYQGTLEYDEQNMIH